MRLIARRFVIFAFATGFLTFSLGCLEVDNQLLAPPHVAHKINPPPDPRDFIGNNQRHQILVAILDTGVDYNHPLLSGHMHFDLDASGSPIGLGYDYLGQDPWPAPYLARTVDIDPDAPAERVERSRKVRKILKDLIGVEPRLKDVIDPDRSVELEAHLAEHGTHVAALSAYDSPEIGLIPYRVLPSNATFQNGEFSSEAHYRDSAAQILAATKDALRRGVRIINYSLSLKRSDLPIDLQDSEFENWKREFVELVKSAPSVVFVAAAGNDSSHSKAFTVTADGHQLPCGLPGLPNLICVTATAAGKSGGLATFSNHVVLDLLQISAPGEEILSAVPRQMCFDDLLKIFGIKSLHVGPDGSLLREWAKDLRKACLNGPNLARRSGTSMASPLASRLFGKMLVAHPEQTGSQVIQRVLHETKGRLRPPRPSWDKSTFL